MFKSAAIATASAALALGGCDRQPNASTEIGNGTFAAEGSSRSSELLGRIDDVSVHLKEISGDFFVVATCGGGTTLIKHDVPPFKRGESRGFSIMPVDGRVEGCKLYQLDVHGTTYILAVNGNASSDTLSITRKS